MDLAGIHVETRVVVAVDVHVGFVVDLYDSVANERGVDDKDFDRRNRSLWFVDTLLRRLGPTLGNRHFSISTYLLSPLPRFPDSP